MADIPNLLLASLSPHSRKQAEQNLNVLSSQSGFLDVLLRLTLQAEQDRAVRLAASVLFKNVIRRRWDETSEDTPLPAAERAQIRAQLIPAMISLSGTQDKALRAQIAETISTVAEYDFPERWEGLIDDLVSNLSPSPSSYSTNLSILETAHSIFRPWRSSMRTDALYTLINFVLSRFAEPFLQIFRYTASALFSTPTQPLAIADLKVMAQTQATLVVLFYDLTCQDVPPAIEDANMEFFGPESGWFMRFLSWNPVELQGDPEDATPSIPSQIKTHVFELAELYTHRYPELLAASSAVESFVQILWNILGGNGGGNGGDISGIGYDGLVSQSLRFLSTAIRSGTYKQIFESPDTISGLVERVVVPNVGLREHEVDQFTDDPLEYMRLDLSLASGSASSSSSSGGGLTAEGTTRRQASADVLRALVSSGFEGPTTEVVGAFIARGLQTYATNPNAEDAWKEKDVAVYLLSAVATRGGTVQQGVTSTNALVDVVQFFSDNVFNDLQADPGSVSVSVHPILQVDAIRYLYTFRNLLTKDQLIAVLPILLRHLASPNYVCYSYAALTIERILFIKRGSALLFTQSDIREIVPSIIDSILTRIENAGTPEKIAENDYLMKCIMRCILTARQTLIPTYDRILRRLVGILAAISRNPSNPNFDQFLFESMSALIRFIVAANPETLSQFEQALFGPLTIIVQQDIDQYVPYVFQLMSQMLELHSGATPEQYRALLPFMIQPASWQQKGSIPGLVRLFKAFLKRDSEQLIKNNQIVPILGVIQQKLIPSRINDAWGFELLQAVFMYIPPTILQGYMQGIVSMLLTRLQNGKTDNYVYYFTYFCFFVMGLRTNALTPDFLIRSVDALGPQLWSQVLNSIILPNVHRILPKDRKVIVIGLTRMLLESQVMLQEQSQLWMTSLSSLVKLFNETSHLTSAQKTHVEDPDEALRNEDLGAGDASGAGYQVAYSRLAASESAVTDDPFSDVGDTKEFVGKTLQDSARANPRVGELLAVARSDAQIAVFLQALAQAGYTM